MSKIIKEGMERGLKFAVTIITAVAILDIAEKIIDGIREKRL